MPCPDSRITKAIKVRVSEVPRVPPDHHDHGPAHASLRLAQSARDLWTPWGDACLLRFICDPSEHLRPAPSPRALAGSKQASSPWCVRATVSSALSGTDQRVSGHAGSTRLTPPPALSDHPCPLDATREGTLVFLSLAHFLNVGLSSPSTYPGDLALSHARASPPPFFCQSWGLIPGPHT